MATILIVEDEQPIRELLNITLMVEHQVVQAANAAEAIELAQRLRPDLVLLDLDLEGDQDGLEVCRTLRSEPDPILAQVPIVMLTGQTTQADIRAALKAGANSYMGKPYSPKALLAVVNALLGKRGVP
jgi:DNA-binding response OmpR family regulator